MSSVTDDDPAAVLDRDILFAGADLKAKRARLAHSPSAVNKHHVDAAEVRLNALLDTRLEMSGSGSSLGHRDEPSEPGPGHPHG